MKKVAVIRLKRKHAQALAALVPGATAQDVIVMALSLGINQLDRAAKLRGAKAN